MSLKSHRRKTRRTQCGYTWTDLIHSRRIASCLSSQLLRLGRVHSSRSDSIFGFSGHLFSFLDGLVDFGKFAQLLGGGRLRLLYSLVELWRCNNNLISTHQLIYDWVFFRKNPPATTSFKLEPDPVRTPLSRSQRQFRQRLYSIRTINPTELWIRTVQGLQGSLCVL